MMLVCDLFGLDYGMYTFVAVQAHIFGFNLCFLFCFQALFLSSLSKQCCF